MKNNNSIFNNLTIMTMSVPIYRAKSQFKIANASTFYTNDLIIDPKLFLFHMSRLKLHSFKVYCILEDENTLPLKKSHIFYDRKEDPNEILSITYLSFEDFFKIDTVNYLFDDNKEKSFEYIFIFNTQNWRQICDAFALTSINISGGSNTKKHILSPINHRLSLFLMCLYSGSNSSNEINKSFNMYLGNEGKKMNDFSTKEKQNLIFELIKSDNLSDKILEKSSLREQEETEETRIKISMSGSAGVLNINQKDESFEKSENQKENFNSNRAQSTGSNISSLEGVHRR